LGEEEERGVVLEILRTSGFAGPKVASQFRVALTKPLEIHHNQKKKPKPQIFKYLVRLK
jgi:hypothetical protein